MRDLTVLMTAIGAPGAPGIIYSLEKNGERKIKIIGTDMNKEAVGFSMVKKHFLVPSGNSSDYISRMLEIVEKEKPDILLPLATYELSPLAENKDKFESLGCKVLVSSPEALKIANNKAELCKFLDKKGIPTPKIKLPASVKEFEKAVYDLGYPEKPVCFKPVIGKGSRGFRILKSDIDKLDLLLRYKPDTTITTLEDILDLFENVKDFPELVIMEYLSGAEYSVDLLVKNGKAILTVPRRRDLIKAGISFIGTVEKNQKVIDMANSIVRAIGLDYNIGVQLKEDEAGVPKIIEINPRVEGTIILCVAAGVNLPYLAIKQALEETIPKIEPKWGTKIIRYWGWTFLDEKGDPITF